MHDNWVVIWLSALPNFIKVCVHQTASSVQMHGICRSWYYMRPSLCYCKSFMHPSMINMTTDGHCLSAIFVTVIIVFIYQKLFYFKFTINLTTKLSQGGWVVWCDWHVYIIHAKRISPVQYLNLSLYGPWNGHSLSQSPSGRKGSFVQFDTLLNLHHYVTIKL